MAEGVGFEPTVGFPTLDFESSALNRTQPPFLEERRKRRTRLRQKLRRGKRRTPINREQASNIQPAFASATARQASNATVLEIRRSALGVGRSALYSAHRLACPDPSGRQDFSPHEAKNVTIKRLAMSGKLTASCMSTRTATLLLVVDRYSQVLGAAVHQYSQLIRKPQPFSYRHDSTQTRNSARVTK